MKLESDRRLIERLRDPQRGVFTTADLRTALADPHGAAFTRRVNRLLDAGILWRFTRGFYVTESFDLELLSCRIAPHSCVSFETVLAGELFIGPRPERRVVATKVGPGRTYAARGYEIEHLSLSQHLNFGCTSDGGIRRANAEKAVLDVLYFHLRGRSSTFDIYSDLRLDKLDRERLARYIERYRNPKYKSFARHVLQLS